MKKKKDTLKERVDELEAQVRWLSWLIDKHIYEKKPIYYFYDSFPKPDLLKGWVVADGTANNPLQYVNITTGDSNEKTKKP